ncbi:OLC1v1018353C1 [Oldenlandia corymbosa var. corymbosa]|uniref:OLC1v1018353C1 n=1 Tax=Oldenlandia corymbosa var. corymbosa TaxID=529605 RepID=A0AAV1EBM5_OLDCO|nr:OLC1v1018353C1 [Oldenlandia corymbosa var. corymbosa]
MVLSKFSLLLKKQGRHSEEEQVHGLIRESNNVNEEYMEVFRTNSFIEMYNKIQNKWGSKSIEKLPSPRSLPHDQRFSQGLLDPDSSTLAEILLKIPDDEIRQVIAIFFRISSEACRIFESVLKSIHQTRANYSAIGRVIEQLQRTTDYDDDQRNKLYGRLASFALLRNPLATTGKAQFQDIHDNLYESLQQFTSRAKKIRRRRKLVKFCKRIAGGTLIATCCVLAIALIILTIHSVVGIAAVPGLAASSLGLFLKRVKNTRRVLTKTTYLERLEAQLDNAAKGIYLLINDFDTMSRIMARLHDEIEHGKFIADLYQRRSMSNEMVLKEVVREFRTNRNGVINHLKELEDQVHLCILNINRSRRLLTQGIVVR